MHIASAHTPRHQAARRGQALVEYTIIAGIIGISSIVTVTLFGGMSAMLLENLGKAMKAEPNEGDSVIAPVWEQLGYAMAMEDDANVFRHMGNFDTGVGGDMVIPDAPPPIPPMPSDPLAYAATHHVGDNHELQTGPQGGFVNEGLSYDISFTLSQEMINYANYANGGTLFLTFNAGMGVDGLIHNENVNGVFVNGQHIGNVDNGYNSMTFDVSGMNVGDQTLTFTSGELKTERDDYNFSDMMISYDS